jgi:pimeloyl-ACP methyl ester carboxylesterase
MNALVEKDVLAGPVPISYIELGSGAPILYLHGAGGPVPDAPFLKALAEHGRVIAPSHPGFGRAVLPDWMDSIEDLSYVYLDLLDALDLHDVTVIGHSMGGWLAAEIAVKSTARIGRLILVDAVGIKVSDRNTRDIADIFATAPADLQRLVYHDLSKAPDLSALSDEAMETIARNREASALYLWEPYAHNPKLPRRLHRIKVPVLFIWGESDGLVTPAYGRAFSERVPGSRFEVIANAGHVPQAEQTAKFVEIVAAFHEKR